MRANKSILVATVLGAWIFISYFLWARQAVGELPESDGYRDVYRKLNQLEADVRLELQTNRDLVQRLLAVVRGMEKINAIEAAAESDQDQEPPIVRPSVLNLDDLPPRIRAAAQAAEAEAAASAAVISSSSSSPSAVQHLRPGNLVTTNNNATIVAGATDTAAAASRQRGVRGPIIPILVFACNRVSVAKCLDNLLAYRPNAHQFPIIVSLDCDDADTRNVIQSYKDVTMIRQPDQSDPVVPPKEKKFRGYYKISRHYGWALNATFQHGYEFVVVVEDDLNVAPDFYEYFLGTHELLRGDPSLWCVSAWNDNGKAGVIDKAAGSLLYRTDFFPGLGWMLTRELWSELAVKWPVAFWDDWIRQPQQRKDRACIRPEISRTRTFGKVGVSNGLFFEKHLRYIQLSDTFVEFTKINMTALTASAYDRTFLAQVYACPLVTFDELRRGIVESKGAVRIQYNTKDQYKRTAKLLGLMDDFKSGVPRTGYHGIVSFFYNNQRVYLAPNINWKGYDLSWS